MNLPNHAPGDTQKLPCLSLTQVLKIQEFDDVSLTFAQHVDKIDTIAQHLHADLLLVIGQLVAVIEVQKFLDVVVAMEVLSLRYLLRSRRSFEITQLFRLMSYPGS